jgi:hypothetical protein
MCAVIQDIRWGFAASTKSQRQTIVSSHFVDLTTLYRPVGRQEYDLIAAADFRRFPPRLPAQPFFYPVTNAEYATQIARDWNT